MNNRCWTFLVFASVLAWQCTGVLADSPTPIAIAGLIATPRSEAAKRPEVYVKGTVSLIGEGLASPEKGLPAFSSICIEDESAGIWISVSQARRESVWKDSDDILLALREGVAIEMRGLLAEGAFAPVILPATIKIIGVKPLPPAQDVVIERFLSGADDVRRVKASGVVQSIADEGGKRWLLKVETGLGHFLARLPKTDTFAPTRLLDAEVQMTGVAAVSRNWRAEFVCPRLVISHEEDVVILKEAPLDPFSAKSVPLNELDSFSPDGRPLHRRRISGVITYHQPHEFLFLQDGACAVRIEPGNDEQLKVGDRIEATGFIDTSRNVAGLSGAVLRKHGSSKLPVPIPLTMSNVVDDFDLLRTGRSPRLKGCDGLLVNMTGRLLSIQGPTPDGEHRLEMDCGDSVSTAVIREKPEAFLPGTEMQLTGIASVQYAPTGQTANYAKPIRLDLLLRDRHDILVLKRPSWWTLSRTFAALLAVGGVALAVLAWAVALRRTVAQQTKLLAHEMRTRRDAAVEFQASLRERTRLAANLHDTVLQTMTGIAYQIEACESEALPIAHRTTNHLETVRRMVQRGQDDLRSAVWALRALPLKERTFSESVRSVATQISDGHDVEVDVECSMDLPVLADFIAGNLLLVVQEAIHNAIKHADPKRIRVALTSLMDGKRLRVSIDDDGIGFVFGQQPNSQLGHFGLEGMRERVERLGGTLEIKSQPASGTHIIAEVPIRDFDSEIA